MISVMGYGIQGQGQISDFSNFIFPHPQYSLGKNLIFNKLLEFVYLHTGCKIFKMSVDALRLVLFVHFLH
jgi:hypothetical protein